MASYVLSINSFYLVSFSKYLTTNIPGFDLDLWPLEVTWHQKFSHYSKVHTRLCILYKFDTFPLFLSCISSINAFYLVPFSKYLTSNFPVISWFFTFRSHLTSIILSLFESPYTTLYLVLFDTFPLFLTFFRYLTSNIRNGIIFCHFFHTDQIPTRHLSSKGALPGQWPWTQCARAVGTCLGIWAHGVHAMIES